MRLLLLELKRILKTRYVQFILLASVGLTILLAYAPISFVGYTYQDSEGQEVKTEGLEAIRLQKEAQSEYSGIIEPKLIAGALKQYQECSKKYEHGIYDENMPVSEYASKIAPVSFITGSLAEVYADSKTGMAAEIMGLTEEDAEGFYEQCSRHLADLMDMEQKDHPQAKEKAIAMYEKVEKPFSYYPGADTNSLEYLGILVFLMVVLSIVIAAPTFSSEYQTESDQILRCTVHGKIRLAVTKLIACILVMTVVYALCLTIFMVVINTAFGWEARQTDIQFLFSAITFLPMTLGSIQKAVIMMGYLTMLASIFFTLFLSSKCRTIFASSLIGLGICLLPIFVYSYMGGNAGNWIRCILPSGGTGLNNSFLYALLDTGFVYLGNQAFWVPYVMIAAAAADALLFMVLTVRSYCRHHF